MDFDRLEYYKRQFPHWLDRNDLSNFSRLIKVLVNQETDKKHKIRSLDYARRISKPIQIWREQFLPYEYDINFRVLMDNLKTVNVYVNPIVNDDEKILSFEKCFTYDYNDDGFNNSFNKVFHGNTGKYYLTPSVVEWGEDDEDYVQRTVYETIFYNRGDGNDETDFTKPNTFIYNTETTFPTVTSNGIRVCNEDPQDTDRTRLYWANITENSSLSNYYQYEPPFVVEGEIVNSTVGAKGRLVSLAVRDSVNNNYKTLQSLGIEDGGKFKIVYDVDKIRYYANDELKYTVTSNLGDKCSFILYIPSKACVTYKNITIKKPTTPPIIPNDTFLLEAITYDDYRWVKGYPENDNNELYSIYREKSSYTDYLTFKIAKQNIKKIRILKNDELAFEKELFHLIQGDEKGSIIYHDYQPEKKIQEYDGILVSDMDDDDYKFQLILSNEDLDENGNVKDNYDLQVYLYDKNNPSCEVNKTIITKRYNGYERTNWDCFSHDLSLDMLGHYWNIPRREYITKDQYDDPVEYYEKTIPPYNNHITEDDYNYQKRIKEYIQRYNKDYFPILELWKNYGINGTLFNRKNLLSRMDESYICEDIDFYIENKVNENGENKLNIHEGLSNSITINEHSWDESVICNNLFVVPETDYLLQYNLLFDEQTDLDMSPPTYHLYYYDKQGNCHHQEKTAPKLATDFNEATEPVIVQTDDNSYSIKAPFKTVPNACKLDIVLECDNPFKYSQAQLTRVKIVDKTPMFMTTKENYNSCVYELKTDYAGVPSNINFTNSNLFDKLLQKSLPLSHKGLLNVSMDTLNSETLSIGTDYLWQVETLFDDTISHGETRNSYEFSGLTHFINPNETYLLKVTFNIPSFDEPLTCPNGSDNFININLKFRTDINTQEYTEMILDRVKCNVDTIYTKKFTIPSNMNVLDMVFESTDGAIFEYKDLSLNRLNDSNEVENLWVRISD